MFACRYAIPAVNCVTSSSVNACLEAAAKAKAPIMIQFSSGGAQFYAGKGLDNTDVRPMSRPVCPLCSPSIDAGASVLKWPEGGDGMRHPEG